jgi:hypothetical protein
MDAFHETHRDDRSTFPIPQASPMRPVLGLAMMLTVLIGAATMGTIWNAPQMEPTQDQAWSLVGP